MQYRYTIFLLLLIVLLGINPGLLLAQPNQPATQPHQLFLPSVSRIDRQTITKAPEQVQAAAVPNRPFPQHVTYAAGTLRPTNFTQAQQDDHVRAFYNYWKDTYLTAAGMNSSGQPRYRVRFGKSGANANATVSEGQGYGMIVTALMAGYDSTAQAYFDGLWRFALDYPSGIDKRLMSWKIVNGLILAEDGNASAFDGDADIAYGLLLAHAQWGSNGAINYQAAAKQVLDGILASTIGPQSRLPMLGDWVSSDGGQYTPRSSDFMLAHFRTFGRATNNPVWHTVATNVQSAIDQIQRVHSPNTGLLPDFLVNCNPLTSCRPSDPNFLEGSHDGHYYYNAGRNPWRIGVDVLLNGNAAAQSALQKSVRWLALVTGGNAQNIKAGYQLNGTPIGDYFTTFFVAPFGVAAMADPTQQLFLNNIYASVYNTRENYFEDSVNLLALLAMTGNYWDPAPAGNSLPTSTPTPSPSPTPSPINTVAPPTATPLPTATPTVTPTRLPGACLVTYQVVEQWSNGFTADLTFTNQTGTTLNGWTIAWNFPGNQRITELWNGRVNQSNANVSVMNAGWNSTVVNGASVSIGFVATFTGANSAPSAFTLNGIPCTLTDRSVLFIDGFEIGNLGNWWERVVDGGDLSANATAALVGSYGMNALIDDNIAIYVTDDRPASETGYSLRFRFDPNTIRMANGDLHTLFYGYTGTATQVLRLELYFAGGQYQLRAALRDDGAIWKTSVFLPISDAPHLLQLDWRAATAARANNGTLAFRIDGVLKANLTGVDNDTRRIDRIRLGAVLDIDNGTRGAYFFDDFASYRLSTTTATAAFSAAEAATDDTAFLEEVTAAELAAEQAEAVTQQLFLPLITR